ncbi:hypothetical protein D9756_010712 [Leucocoprinus leucothites]|uniref:Uncharacterized protein n=1 Tax=Leucocoprinus leucothites TaxID=201217 RepID=A0A8H5FSL3_9AGAR|nr:hypothetical protein D9756_010712 [Leucoagaricus leucothites]
MLERLEEASERGEVFRTGMELAADRVVVRVGGEVRRAVDDDSEKTTAPQRRRFNTQPQDLPYELLEVGWSGSIGVGCFGSVLAAVAAHIRYLQEHKWKIDEQGCIRPRGVFSPALAFRYYKLCKTYGGPCKPLDQAMVEATVVAEDGYITPSASVKAIYEIVLVKKIMVKVNTRIPYVEGLHDVDHSFVPPNRSPTHVVTRPQDRIGPLTIPINPDRIIALVQSSKPDSAGSNAPPLPKTTIFALSLATLINFDRQRFRVDIYQKVYCLCRAGLGTLRVRPLRWPCRGTIRAAIPSLGGGVARVGCQPGIWGIFIEPVSGKVTLSTAGVTGSSLKDILTKTGPSTRTNYSALSKSAIAVNTSPDNYPRGSSSSILTSSVYR